MSTTRILLPTLFALILAPLAATPAQASPPTPASNAGSCSAAHRAEVEAFVDTYIEIYANHELDRLDEVLTPDSINYNSFGAMDVAALTATMEGFFVAFPDLDYQLVELVIDGDRVVVEYTYTGTHLGPLMGAPATGIVIHGRGLEIHTLADDGRIAETNNYSDIFTLFTQLGMI